MLGTFTPRLSACILSVGLTTGCASVPSLDHAELTEISLLSSYDLVGRAKSYWPMVRLTFLSDRPLFDPDTTLPRVQFEICDASGEERHLRPLAQSSLWNNLKSMRSNSTTCTGNNTRKAAGQARLPCCRSQAISALPSGKQASRFLRA